MAYISLATLQAILATKRNGLNFAALSAPTEQMFNAVILFI